MEGKKGEEKKKGKIENYESVQYLWWLVTDMSKKKVSPLISKLQYRKCISCIASLKSKKQSKQRYETYAQNSAKTV